MAVLGAAIVGFVTASAGTIAVNAIVGAVIGGLTAAISGGDVGKGVLFGAVGGAVISGAGAWASSATAGTSAFGPYASGYKMYGTSPATAGSSALKTVPTQGANTISGSLQKGGKWLLDKYGGNLIEGAAGKLLEGRNQKKQHKYKLEQIEAQHKGALELQAKTKHPPYLKMERIKQETRREEMSELRRENEAMRAERQQQRQDLLNEKSSRRALFRGFRRDGEAVQDHSPGDVSVIEMMEEKKEALA